MNSGESSLGKGKRPRISSEIEEIVVPSSDEERQATSKNKKKVKLPEKQAIQNKNISTKPFSEIWDYYEKVRKETMDITKLLVHIASQNGQEESHKKWKHIWQINVCYVLKKYQDTGVKR